jgi:hypothetical protein
MRGDRALTVSLEQDFAGLTGAVPSTDYIDLQNNRDIAVGTPLKWEVMVDETFVGGTSLAIYAVNVNLPNLLDGTTQITLGSSHFLVPSIHLTAGAKHFITINPQTDASNFGASLLNLHGWKYLGLVYQIGGTITSGKLTARIATSDADNKPRIYPATNT